MFENILVILYNKLIDVWRLGDVFMKYDDPEYDFHLYQKLMDRWNERFETQWKGFRRYWNDERLEAEKNKDFSVSSETAKNIYLTLNTEKNFSSYQEMFGYLSKRSAKELLEAEKLVPEFMAFLQKSDMTPEQQLKMIKKFHLPNF